jgi:hypothetical protein
MPVASPPVRGPELDTLTAFLDYYRAVIVNKASGLEAADPTRDLVRRL